MNNDSPLSPRDIRICHEYIKDLNGTQAAIRCGCKPASARSVASRALNCSEGKALVEKLSKERVEVISVEASQVLRELIAIALTDTNDLVEYRRNCCRFCFGIDHKYQFSQSEFDQAKAAHAAAVANSLIEGTLAPPPFDSLGGGGFNRSEDPNPECPECNGEGVGDIYIKDTRYLSPAARALYAGIRFTRDGVELKMHSKERALELLGRHLALFQDKVELSGTIDLAEKIRQARNRAGQ